MGDIFSSTGNINNKGTNGNGNVNNANGGTANGNVVNTYGSTDEAIEVIWKLYSQNSVLFILFFAAFLAIIVTFIYFLCIRRRNSLSTFAYLRTEIPLPRVPVQCSNRRDLIKSSVEPLLFSP